VSGNESPDRRYGDIQSVIVGEEHRNRGVGGALMAAILTEARLRGLLHLTARTRDQTWGSRGYGLRTEGSWFRAVTWIFPWWASGHRLARRADSQQAPLFWFVASYDTEPLGATQSTDWPVTAAM
jgi:Acetyltransferase (GNAT) family